MLAWRIALRYLFSKKSHGAVNIISIISVAGVAVATAAIVIVLSVFNGFVDLANAHLAGVAPDIRLEPRQGKAVAAADSLAAAVEQLPCVAAARPVVEERGLWMREGQQMPVIFKGVPMGYDAVADIGGAVVDGMMADSLWDKAAAQVCVGVALATDSRPGAIASLYVPRRVGRINPANPSASFRGAEMMVSGVFQVDHVDYDNDRVYIPIATARELLEYGDEGTAIEVALAPGTSQSAAIRQIEAAAPAMRALTREQQEEESFKMIKIEKWVTFLMLAFILAIASFNIISTLSLLVIEKRHNMDTLRAIGAPRRLVTNIFICQGWLISVAGGIAGIALGSLLTLAQQLGRFIRLSGDPSQLAIAYYPVRLMGSDLLVVLGLVALVALASSQATRLFNK